MPKKKQQSFSSLVSCFSQITHISFHFKQMTKDKQKTLHAAPNWTWPWLFEALAAPDGTFPSHSEPSHNTALHDPTGARSGSFLTGHISKTGPTCEVFVCVLHRLPGKYFHPPLLHFNNLWDGYWNFNHTHTHTNNIVMYEKLSWNVQWADFHIFPQWRHSPCLETCDQKVSCWKRQSWPQFKDKPYTLLYYKRCVSCSVFGKLTVARWCCLTCSSRFFRHLIKVPVPVITQI